MCVWGVDGDWDVLCERCGWSGTGIESEAAANAAADEHLAAGCRPPARWDHLGVSFASGMGPSHRQ